MQNVGKVSIHGDVVDLSGLLATLEESCQVIASEAYSVTGRQPSKAAFQVRISQTTPGYSDN